METLRALFVRFWSNAARLQVSNDRLPVEFINAQAKVVYIPGWFLLSKREMAGANP